MTEQDWSRRAVMAALAGGAVLRAAGAGAQPAPHRFAGVAVDTARLARQGLPAVAAAIHDGLLRAMRRTFADLVAAGERGAPILVARIDSFSLASYAGNNFGVRSGNPDNDYLEGAGLVVAGGQVLSETPILSALSASYSGAWYLPDIDARRIASITEHFASWLRRDMGV